MSETNMKNTNILFTRHAYSCNNMSDKILGVDNALEKDYDPSLTVYGILQTLEKSINNKERYTSNHVFVPCTIRTWMTATLLYIGNLPENTNTLFLIVSPYLKEKDIGDYDIGNLPIDIESQVKKYKRFLQLLNSYDKTILLDKKIILYFFQDQYIILNFQNDDIKTDNYFDPYPKNKQHRVTVNETPIESTTLNSYISFLKTDEFKTELINDNVQSEDTCEKGCNFPVIPTDTIDINNILELNKYHTNHFSYYDKDNIVHFIIWLNITMKYLQNSIANIKINGIKMNAFDTKNIYSVTHSQTMQDFINFFLKNNKNLNHYAEVKKQYEKYNKMNSWDIHLLGVNVEKNIKINNIYLYNGIPKMKDSQKKLLVKEFGKKFKKNNEQLCTFNRFNKTKGGKKKVKSTRKNNK